VSNSGGKGRKTKKNCGPREKGKKLMRRGGLHEKSPTPKRRCDLESTRNPEKLQKRIKAPDKTGVISSDYNVRVKLRGEETEKGDTSPGGKKGKRGVEK